MKWLYNDVFWTKQTVFGEIVPLSVEIAFKQYHTKVDFFSGNTRQLFAFKSPLPSPILGLLGCRLVESNQKYRSVSTAGSAIEQINNIQYKRVTSGLLQSSALAFL